jgi:Ca2+-binding RTX toxin-like protein
MTILTRIGKFSYTSSNFTWSFGGTYSSPVTLNFIGSMAINAPSSLAVAAVSFESATVNVMGRVTSTAALGAIVTLPVPVPPGQTPPRGPVDELIAAGAVLGDARVNFVGYVSSQIVGGGAIGAFSALSDAYVYASGEILSKRGFALRTQAASGDAHSTTNGLVKAGGGECAIMVEGRENSFVLNRAAVHSTGVDVAGILATGRVDLTFSGNRVAALENSNVSVVNSGALKTSGDGIRAEAQGNIEVRNRGSIDADAIGIHLRDIDGHNSVGQASVWQSGFLRGDSGGIVIEGDFAAALVEILGVVNGGEGPAVSTGSGDDILHLGAGARAYGDIFTGEGNDQIRLDCGARAYGVIDTGAGSDEIHLGSNDFIVDSGAGNDILFAGSGYDTFVFQSGEVGNDILYGFNAAQDRLLFDGGIFNICTERRDTLIEWSGGSVRLVDTTARGLEFAVSSTF